MPGAIPAASTYLTITRDKLIEMAYKAIGVLEPGQVLDGEQLNDGVSVLTMIVREVDASQKWRWTIDEAVHVPLVSGVFLYTIDNGLPSNITELMSATYRDGQGNDTPLATLKAERWEEIPEKTQYGTPKAVYLTDHLDLSRRELYVWPTLETVVAQSQIDGPYRCIRTHTSKLNNEPMSGANAKVYWEPGGEGGDPWQSGIEYTAPPQIRLLHKRPLIDFLTSGDNPDFPLPWPRLLLYRLAFDLGDFYSIPLEERKLMIDKAKGAFDDIHPSVKVKTNQIHNKTLFY